MRPIPHHGIERRQQPHLVFDRMPHNLLFRRPIPLYAFDTRTRQPLFRSLPRSRQLALPLRSRKTQLRTSVRRLGRGRGA